MGRNREALRRTVAKIDKRAAKHRRDTSPWQPIKTAPKNADQILLWSSMWDMTFGVVIGHWGGDKSGWVCTEFITADWPEEDHPTHWMEIPPTPDDK